MRKGLDLWVKIKQPFPSPLTSRYSTTQLPFQSIRSGLHFVCTQIPVDSKRKSICLLRRNFQNQKLNYYPLPPPPSYSFSSPYANTHMISCHLSLLIPGFTLLTLPAFLFNTHTHIHTHMYIYLNIYKTCSGLAPLHIADRTLSKSPTS